MSKSSNDVLWGFVDCVVYVGATAGLILGLYHAVGKPLYRTLIGPVEAPSPLTSPSPATDQRDAAEGFELMNEGDLSGVLIYRDTKTGCEWVTLRGRGAGLKERTAPDADGVSRHICHGKVN